jgi:hypothetical protein
VARIRTIKPTFFTSATIAELSPWGRLMFLGLLTHVDDEGRCINEPRVIKGALFPLDDVVTASDVVNLTMELEELGLVRSYEAGKRSYLVVCSFREHQRINRPSKSTLPPPPPFSEDSVNAHGVLTDGSLGEGKGRENTYAHPPKIKKVRTPHQKRVDSPDFDAFWAAYPRRVGKANAVKAWARLQPPLDVVLTAIAVQSRSWTDPAYIPHPTTWLNARRWEDEVAPAGRDTFRQPQDW